jgi:hypothetical protein
MRMLAWIMAGMSAAGPIAAQQRAVATVSLVARKQAVVGLTPLGADAQLAGLTPAIDASPPAASGAVGLMAIWNLPPEQIGDLRLRTTRGALPAGASYIERRVVLLDPVAHARHDLDLRSERSAASDALVVVRLVVY